MSQVTDIHSQSTPVADPESVVTLTTRSLESGRTQQPTEEQEGRELRKTSQEVKTVAASHHHRSFIDSDNFIINMVSGYLESVSGVTVSVHARLWQTGDLWQWTRNMMTESLMEMTMARLTEGPRFIYKTVWWQKRPESENSRKQIFNLSFLQVWFISRAQTLCFDLICEGN